MNNTIAIVTRGTGFTATLNGSEDFMFHNAYYFGNSLGGVQLFAFSGTKICDPILPEGWTVGGVSGYTTQADLCNALDTLGLK